MNQREQDNLNARLRARSMNLPRMVRCDRCSMPYYQTSAPHVCAGWVTKENRAVNESEKFITTGVFSHERNPSGNCSVSGCPCRGWSAQESVNEHEHEPVARGEESGPAYYEAGVVAQQLGYSPLPWRVVDWSKESDAEPVIDIEAYVPRGGGTGMTVAELTHYKSFQETGIPRSVIEANAQMIVTAVNRHHSLLTERERLRGALVQVRGSFQVALDEPSDPLARKRAIYWIEIINGALSNDDTRS